MSFARRTLASLARPAYRRYFLGHVASLLGFWIRVVVQGWLVYEITGRRDMLGAVTAAGLLPFVLLSPLGGVLADRWDRRLLLLWIPAASIVANIALGILVLTGQIAVGHVFATAVLIGSARAVEIPVRNAFVRDLVGREDLSNAIALNAAGFNVARVVGPALGAALLALFGVGPCFLVSAALNATMVIALLGITTSQTRPTSTPSGAWSQLAEGLRYVRGHRRTRTLLLLLAISLVCMWTYQTLMPAFASDQLGMEKEGYALLMAVPGVGALLGALWVAGRAGRRRAGRRVVFGLVWTGAACVFALGFVHHVALALPALCTAGFCQVGFMATANGLVQESVPDALRGRVMGIWTFVFGGCFPLGGFLMGQVAQYLSITAAWSGGAVLTLLLSLVVRLRLPPRRPEAAAASLPSGAPPPVPTDPGA